MHIVYFALWYVLIQARLQRAPVSAFVWLAPAELKLVHASETSPDWCDRKDVMILNKCISCQEKTDRNSRYEWGGWPTLGSAPALTALSNLNYNFDNTNIYMKSSFPKRYKSIWIVFMKMTFFLPRPIHFVNIQFILLKWSVGSVWTC